MRYRRIANTDIAVSEIGFGVWTLASGWWGEYSDTAAITLLRQAFDRGVTFFDTADTYGNGRGERLLAQAFPGADRDEIVIGTKCGYDWAARSDARRAGQREAPQRFDVPFLERALDASLERLGCEHVDLWQLHNVRMAQLADDALWAFLERVQRDGRVRAVGVALGPAIDWLEEGEHALRARPAATVQMIYNALELDPGRALIAAAREQGRSLLVRVPHASGMLEGRYTAETTFAEGDHRRHRPERWLREGLHQVEQLRFLVDGTGRTLGQAALRFALYEPCVASVLPNVYELAQLDEFVGASDCADLSADEVARVVDLYEHNYGLPRAAAEVAGS